MAVTGPTHQQYELFREKGGTIIFNIDASDISSDNTFENFTQTNPDLYTGFELIPSSIIDNPKEVVQIYMYGNTWTQIVTFVYRNGGEIIYKKIPSGNFQAKCTIPPKI